MRAVGLVRECVRLRRALSRPEVELPAGSAGVAGALRRRADRRGLVSPTAVEAAARECSLDEQAVTDVLWGLEAVGLAEPAWEEVLEPDGTDGEHFWLGWRLADGVGVRS